MSIDRIPAQTVAELLSEIIPIVHANGQDHYVEALSEALDAIQWRPLHEAPRDGTWVFIAVAPRPVFNLDGFVGFGRWVPAPEDGQMNKEKRIRAAAADGWWSTSAKGNPLKRPVLAWRPAPTFDFSLYLEPIAKELAA